MADENPAAAPVEVAKLEVQAAMYKAQFSTAVERLEGNLGDLFKHLENMAGHIVAFEAVLTVMVKTWPVDREGVAREIRDRIAANTGGQGNPDVALGVAERIIG